MTSKFYLQLRSPQDLIDTLVMSAPGSFDRRTSKLSYLRVPGLRADQLIVEATFASEAAEEAALDDLTDRAFELPGVQVLDADEFAALQATAAARMAPPRTVSIDPQSFSGCGDPTYRAPVKREGE